MSRFAEETQPNRCSNCRFSVEGGLPILQGIPPPGERPVLIHFLLCKECPPGTLEVHPKDWCYRWGKRA